MVVVFQLLTRFGFLGSERVCRLVASNFSDSRVQKLFSRFPYSQQQNVKKLLGVQKPQMRKSRRSNAAPKIKPNSLVPELSNSDLRLESVANFQEPTDRDLRQLQHMLTQQFGQECCQDLMSYEKRKIVDRVERMMAGGGESKHGAVALCQWVYVRVYDTCRKQLKEVLHRFVNKLITCHFGKGLKSGDGEKIGENDLRLVTNAVMLAGERAGE